MLTNSNSHSASLEDVLSPNFDLDTYLQSLMQKA
jgi:hypothetical protein